MRSGSLLLIAGVVLFSGCGSIPVHREAALSIDQFQPYAGPNGIPILPGSVDADIPNADILSISDDMASALDHAVAHAKNPRDRLTAVVGFLTRRVRYDGTADRFGAKTARETFESGAGNCLSLSNLFVAMARHAGLISNYQEIPTPPNWEREGETIFSTRHVAASVDITQGMDRVILVEVASQVRALALDSTRRYFFVPYALSPSGPDINLHLAGVISDQRAFAQYYNNLGSRYMAEGSGAEAFRYIVKALKTDPALSFAWSNLGVVYSRNGQFEAALKAFLRGMALTRGKRDVTALSIMSNLAELYERSGNTEKAEFYRSEASSFRRKNPYYQYAAAVKAYDDGLYEQSIRLSKTAIRLKNDEHLFYYGLALAYNQLGNAKKAEKYIKKAKFHAFSETRKMYYDRVRRDMIK